MIVSRLSRAIARDLSFSKVLAEINQHASAFNLESEMLSALLIQPLISDNFVACDALR